MKVDHTDITIVLDRSGSMDSVKEETIKAFNGFIDSQKTGPGTAVASLVLFDVVGVHRDSFDDKSPEYWPVYTATPVESVSPLDTGTYRPRGGTPLYDAIAKTIINTGKRLEAMAEANRPGVVVFVIQTDGMENQSREFNLKQVQEMIKHQADAYRWQFVFLGADINAIEVAKELEIKTCGAIGYNKANPQATFRSTGDKLSMLRGARAAGQADADFAYDDEDRANAAK